VPVSIDGEWECDKNKMHWICGDHSTMWTYYTETVCFHYCDTHNSSHKCVWDKLGAPDCWGCCCELHPRRMGLLESFPKEALQRSDARNL
jgi:hypothetical protein